MSLFEVPGWTVPETPLPGPPRGARKRKRHLETKFTEKLDSASVNVEKLIAKLGEEHTAGDHTKQRRKKSKVTVVEPITTEVPAGHARPNGKNGGGRREDEGARLRSSAGGSSKRSKKVKEKAKHEKVQPEPAPPPKLQVQRTGVSEGLTVLQSTMKHSLEGARFRYTASPKIYRCDD